MAARLGGVLGVVISLAMLTSGASAQDKGAQDKGQKPPPLKEKWNVAIIVHEGVELLDFAGPGEVFQAAGQGRAFRVYTVAPTTEPVVSQRFLKIVPQYSFKDCPKPDILVIPGGATNNLLKNEAMMAWFKETAPQTQIMFSVCTGAFVLGELGLLDDKDATTHHGSIAGLKRRFPKARVHSDRRVLDNGRVVTSAGVSAGIDGSLHLVARLCGLDAAKATAHYMEYRWEPGPETTKAAAGKTKEDDTR
jgi:transcriptional regulator GlxA family with amidase domain